ncbi:ATP synthase mitochondrial F1 complex assembly factor 2 [Recurvomyces mirabilis]|nr:ATP synthase mitochondrial F1 complex assembly factor 2 [Recurvomyces mirabilis]
MEIRQLSRAIKATSSLSVRRPATTSYSRCLHTTSIREATPLPHPTVVAPPPSAPLASITFPQNRVDRKREQAEKLQQGQQAKINPAKPTTALQKRFWKNVSVKEDEQGLQVLLDTRPVRTASKQPLLLPHSKRALATAIAVEWDQLVSNQQALKNHYIPLTSMVSRVLDIEAADAKDDTTTRQAIVTMVMRYLGTDTLLCWAPEHSDYDRAQEGKTPLRQKQRTVAEPIIAFLKTHVFPGVDILPILGEDSIMPTPQPQVTREVIRGWVSGLPAFELAALERGVLATKSLLLAVRLLVDWSPELAHIRKDASKHERFGVAEAAHAATLEVMHQTDMWGEVEDTHDVEREDLRRQLGSVVMLVG